jgi:hypothetical protein
MKFDALSLKRNTNAMCGRRQGRFVQPPGTAVAAHENANCDIAAVQQASMLVQSTAGCTSPHTPHMQRLHLFSVTYECITSTAVCYDRAREGPVDD